MLRVLLMLTELKAAVKRERWRNELTILTNQDNTYISYTLTKTHIPRILMILQTYVLANSSFKRFSIPIFGDVL